MRFSRLLSEWIRRPRRSLPRNRPPLPPQPRRRVLQLAVLEDRVLYSAGPVPDAPVDGDAGQVAPLDASWLPDAGDAMVILDDHAATSHDNSVEPGTLESNGPETSPANAAADVSADAVVRELVFVDANVADPYQLLDAMGRLGDANRQVEVVMLSADQDGVAQIADAVAGREGIDAIHILSHGSNGELRLGLATLTLDSMASEYADVLRSIGQSLADDADILIYGCNFAEGSAGQAAAQALSHLTGADVAASNDATGHSQLGGDWDLESRTGTIDTSIIVDQRGQDEWHHLLATLDWDSVDWVSESLSQSYTVSGGTVTFTITGDTSRFNSGSPNDDTTNTGGLSPVQESLLLNVNFQAQSSIGDESVTLTIDFSHTGGVSDVSFTLFDVDLNTWTDQVIVTGDNGATINPSSVTVGSAMTFDGVNKVTGTSSNASTSANGNATYTFNQSGIDQITIKYQSGRLSDPTDQFISLHDVSFSVAPRLDLDASGGGTGYSTTFTENGSAVAIADSDSQITDSDSTNLTGATITLTNAKTSDALSVSGSLPSGILLDPSSTSSVIVLTGTSSLANYETALEQLRFNNTSDTPDTTTRLIDVVVQDEAGTASNTATSSISVTAVNDAPANSVPAGQSTSEDTSLVFSSGNGNQISISDVDAGSNNVQVTLTGTNGVVTLGGTSGILFSAGDGTSDATMTFSGSVSAINTALNGLSFSPTANFNGSASLAVTTNDLGNTGSGGAKTDSDSIAITVDAVNDAPINNLPAAQSVNEDASLVFSSGNGNLISISDVDAGSNDVQVTLTGTNGVLTLSSTSGLSFSAGDGTSDATMTFTGTTAAINTALNGLSFLPTANFAGAASLDITTNDQGNSGTGGAQSAGDSLSITVNGVNDAPINTAPGLQTTSANTVLVFSTANGNLVAASDIDAGSSSVRVTLTASNGTLTLNGTTGLTFNSGDGSDDATMTFNGSLTNINAALDGLSLLPTTGYIGLTTVQIVTSDLGNTGNGGAQSDDDSIGIQVGGYVFQQGVNGYSGTEDTEIRDDEPGTAHGNATSITIDLDDGGLTQGLIQFDNIFGNGVGQIPLGSIINSATLTVYVTNTSNSGDLVTLHQMLATWDEASTWNSLTNGVSLNGVEAVSAADSTLADPTTNGFQTFIGLETTVQAWSDGTANHGWAIVTDSDNGWDFRTSEYATASERPYLTIEFTAAQPAAIDLDANNSSGAAGSNFNAAFTEDGGPAIVADVDATITDADSGNLTSLTATITNALDGGAESLDADTTGTSITASYNSGTGALTLSGTDTVANYQQVLRTITYTNTSDTPNTTARSLTFVATDAYSTSNTATTSLSITAHNDSPSNAVPGMQSIAEDATLTFSSGGGNLISVSDVDAGSADLQVTVAGNNGTISLGGTTGLAFSAGDGTSDSTMTFTGSAANINSALNGLSFTANNNFFGGASLAITTNDQGSTGVGGTQSDSDSITITVNEVNDAPVGVADSASVDEDNPLSGNVLTNDVDPDNADGILGNEDTLTAVLDSGPSNGSLTLNADGSFNYTPDADFFGSDSFTYHAEDSDGAASAATTVTITVNEVNDAPIAVADTATVDEDTSLSGDVLPNDVDPDNADGILGNEDTLTAILDSGPSNGSLTLNADGSFSYTPDADFFGTDSFTYYAEDSDGAASVATTVTITVNSLNDAPVNTVPGNQTADEDTPVEFSVANGIAISVADVDAGAAELQVTLSATNGSITLAGVNGLTFSSGDGSADSSMTFTGLTADINAALDGLSFAPDSDFNGTATISVATDDQGSAGTGGTQSDNDSIDIAVDAVNDAPTTIVPGAQSMDEDSTLEFSAANGNAITVADIDAGSGAVQVALNVTNGSLTLSQTSGLTFVTGDGADDAAMQFEGSLSDANAALDGMIFTPDANFFGAAGLGISISDLGNTGSGGDQTSSAGVAIVVNEINDAPIAADDSATTDEDNSVSGEVLANDTDPDNLDGLPGNDDTLIAVLDAGPSNGSLTLNADGSFTYTPNADFFGSDSFIYHTADSDGATSNVATVTIAVNEVNDSPAAVDDFATTDEDNAVSGDVLANDSDPDNLDGLAGNDDSLFAVLDAGPSNGSLVLNADRSFTYTPNADFFGIDTFSYHAEDSDGAAGNAATVTITVNEINDAPIAADDSATTNEDNAVSGDVLANDSDPDNLDGIVGNEDSLSAVLNSGPTDGSLVLNADGSFTYTPNADFFGSDSFSYHTEDSDGAASNVATVTITVNEINDDPIANDDLVTTDEDLAVNGDVLANDTDADNSDGLPGNDETLIAVLETGPANGSLILNADGTFTYTPNGDFFGSDSFTYRTSDGEVLSNVAQVTIMVDEINDAPLAADDSAVVDEDGAVGGDLLANDSDPDNLDGLAGNDDTLIAVLDSGPSNGSLSLNADGSFTYAPNADFFGTDSFTYHAEDHDGAASNTATVTITVNEVNDSPIAVADDVATNEDSAVSGDVLANDTDADNSDGLPGNEDVLFAVLDSGPTNGSLVLNADGTFAYTPDANFFGTDTFSYHAEDSDGAASNVTTVTLTVSEINDEPVGADDSELTDEDVAVSGNVLANDNDPDNTDGIPGNEDTLTAVLVAGPSNGLLVLNADGSFSYSPNADYFGSDSFSYVTIDSDGAAGNVSVVSFTINEVNDNPIGTDDYAATNEDTLLIGNVLANDTDPDNTDGLAGNEDTLSAVLDSGPAHGSLVLNADGSFAYTPDADYFGADSFSYHAVDSDGAVSGTTTVTLTIDEVNDEPLGVDDSATADEDSSVSGNVLSNDSDPDNTDGVLGNEDTLTAVLDAGPANGTLSLNADGTFTYTPNANYFGPDSFSYHAVDSDGASGNVTVVTLTMNEVNDAPIGGDDIVAADEDIAATGNVLTNDADPDNTDGLPGNEDTLSATLVTGPTHGTLVLNSDGTYSYTPNANYNGPDSFSYRAIDSDGQPGNVTTVNFNIAAINDAPVAAAESFTIDQNAPLTGIAPGLLSNDTDVEGSVLTPSLVAGPAHGTVTINADGSFVYTPEGTFSGNDSFSYRVNDGQLDSNVVSVSVQILPIRPAETSDPINLPPPGSGGSPDLGGPLPIGLTPSIIPPMASQPNEPISRRLAQPDEYDSAPPPVAVLETPLAAKASPYAFQWRRAVEFAGGDSLIDDAMTVGETEHVSDSASSVKGFTVGWFWDRQNRHGDDQDKPMQFDNLAAGATMSVVSAFSAGYVLWTLRSGYLLTSFLASMPAWRAFDPLPVLQSFAASGRDDEEDKDNSRQDAGFSTFFSRRSAAPQSAAIQPKTSDKKLKTPPLNRQDDQS